MKILFIGDVVGNPGRKAVKELLPDIRKKLGIDFCIANCENAAGGSGITYVVAQELYKSGIDAITLGNHTWAKREILNFIDCDPRIVRPANYPEGTPGNGSTIISGPGGKIGVLNLLGRVYMDSIDCPFKAADRELQYLKRNVKAIVIDMHAEATSEKCALAWYLDGRVSCVLGTHTHVQTADERILPFGTGYITDVGMSGPYEGIIGIDREIIINRFITHIPAKFEVSKGPVQFNAVYVEVDESTGRTVKIERIFRIVEVS
ncbi:MAG: TIGR00282 family metallophosphoesterase [Clostridia bacterium]|nr:TIGR00282 family metallophosphoesterase [Clostridia bacterium]